MKNINTVTIRAPVSRWSGRILIVVGLATVVQVASCALSLPSASFSLDFVGVTTGGAQDIAHARTIIEAGDIPRPEYFPVEGFLSEHAIPLPQVDETRTLYATGTVSWNRDFDEITPLVTLQVGFGTNIDPETFTRQPLNLCLVIDKSGSMDEVIDERTRATKWEAVRIALDRLLSHLTSDDLVSVVTFDKEAHTLLRAVEGDDIAAIKGAIDDISPLGATDLLRGMRRGYDVVADHSDAQRMDRIIVLTDVLPTSGAFEAEQFIGVMRRRATAGIGATIFGVGADFGQQLAFDISQVRGGNFFFLSDYERIVSVFDEEFDFLVTPVAYDVELEVSIPFEFDVTDVYGVPFDEPLGHVLTIGVPTLFLSAREGGGAILIRLRAGALADFDVANTVASIRLTYELQDGEQADQALALLMPAGLDPAAESSYFETEGSRRAVLLLNTVLVLRQAADDAHPGPYSWSRPSDEDLDRAAARLSEFLPYFDELAEGLAERESENSRSLSQERTLVERLLANVESLRFDRVR